MTNSQSLEGLHGTRRALFAGAAASAAMIAGGGAFAKKSSYIPAPVRDGVSALTPDLALGLLKEGNKAFLQDRPIIADISSRRRFEQAKGQAPFAAFLSCADSRVPPELLFGRGLGELFVVRNAGNVIDTSALGSLEFGVGVLKAPLVVVLGHEYCGAVKAAMSVVDSNATFPGDIGVMIEPIIPAVLQARSETEGDPTDNAVRANVRRQVKFLREHTHPILLDPQKAGKVKVVGAVYDLDTGKVDFFDTI